MLRLSLREDGGVRPPRRPVEVALVKELLQRLVILLSPRLALPVELAAEFGREPGVDLVVVRRRESHEALSLVSPARKKERKDLPNRRSW